jgi:hypothetical protein
MGGQTPALCRGFPSCYFHTLCTLWGCGWVEHDARNCERFGTLLGPEKTSCRLVGCFFWWPLPARDRLTHPCGGAFVVSVWVWWWLCGVRGVVVC